MLGGPMAPRPSPSRPAAQALHAVPDGDRAHWPTHLQLAPDIEEFDRSLIEMLQEDGRRSFVSIAKELGTAEKTVRRRVQELSGLGYMSITTVLDPSVLGYEAMALVGLRLDGSRTAADIVAEIADHNEVDYVAATTGRFQIFVEFVCRDKPRLAEVVEEGVAQVDGVSAYEVFPYLSLYYQQAQFAAATAFGTGAAVSASRLKFDDLDREILRHLALDGRSPYQGIARSLGVNESKVRQRVKRMLDSGAVRIMAITNPQSLGYRTMAWLGVGVRSGTRVLDVAEALARVPAVTYVALCSGRFDMFVEIACRDDAEMLAVLDEHVRVMSGLGRIEVFQYLSLRYKPVLPPS
jgi:Lrp/AsnC family transcriptional regulator for asnA, asnC and gidA